MTINELISLLDVSVFSGLTSPANAKLGLRMTTLHEEPIKSFPRKHSFDLLMDDPIEEQVGESNEDERVEPTVSINRSIEE